METIVALATARGRAGVAIIRVSGDLAWHVCHALAGRVPEPRQAQLMTLRDAHGDMIDQALVLVFEDGRSFTGEKTCEFQIHGSVAVVASMLGACLAIDGVRTAEPGEFTRRAFLNGRMDLTEVEGLADLIDAETDGQRKQAMRVLDGSAGRIVDQWREDLLQALAMIEAAMDFSDEEIPGELLAYVEAPLARVSTSLREQIDGRRASESVRDGFEVAIVGRVNAGKSTLLNALAGRDAAITSERAGTTRDVIEVRMDIAGMAVTLIDTAGLRETQDEIERVGIERGTARARGADLRIFLKSSPQDEPQGCSPDDIVLLSKSDVWGLPGISAITGEGIPRLLAEIEVRLGERVKGSSIFIRERHFDKLSRALKFLVDSQRSLTPTANSWELASEDLRAALRCLDGIVGRVDVEDVLGRIFSSFCIGK
ncbi:tRNA uridine-5-carboxymethylaminomethyl(34) synthesis GTPase MnmE [Pararhodobacter sp.]|uniref:tRNA uridine-5-carboxymethylaminomethyl(34) synthesis GTPase MnmE n=1 Tax=Pararhodobacter sp. TaxID=2127056 RepID=UPI002AFE55EB|nr:tRNA uridine-5-carboxymethylaminomethyl(34) synthesis GTPase MnmE [Pararhodobacter sp.]